ncbi:hypothetical protein ACJVC5_07810 [Peredibacter sp. HCB2-198]|uniref:hypothetical protein n=1 Tax=Peredibacter sp. HCB2-198 TaxID=3383025 RepID=UPI0038B5395D
MEIKIKKGKILIYRVFDIGSEIDLEKVEALFEDKKLKGRFKLDRKHNMSLIISSSPLSIQLGSVNMRLQDQMVAAELIAKVWYFGTVSLCFQIPIPENTNWPELVKIASWIENDEEIEVLAREKAKQFQNDIKNAIPVLNEWSMNEDYVTYFIQELDGLQGPLSTLTEKVDVPALILAESKDILSEQVKKNILENTYQYSRDDLVVVDWNSALVVEPNGSMDVPLVIEFALNQLLELRYYDDLLDQRLNTLYNEVVGKKRGLLSNKYSRLAEDAGQIYLEISEIVENVENSFKTVGDFYLATIFRASSKRFRFDDWQKSINEKLGNLAEISKLLHSEVSESRNQTLEIIIIVLIAIEVVPFLYNLSQ